MSAVLRVLRGGLDDHPLGNLTVRHGRRRNAPVAEPASHVGRPTPPRPPVPLYDHTLDPDRPVIPDAVRRALDIVAQHVRAPGCAVPRSLALEALDLIAAWVDPTTGGAA